MRLYGEKNAPRADTPAKSSAARADAMESGVRENHSTGSTPRASHSHGDAPAADTSVTATMPASDPAMSAVYARSGGSSSNSRPRGDATAAKTDATAQKIAAISPVT